MLYDERYFFDDYRTQYGRTYAEDFDNIYSLSIERVNSILRLIKDKYSSDIRLLDLGSALGFFLKAASDSGIGSVQGLEISHYAAEYCVREFGFNVINSSFDDFRIETFDVITAWYFLEHCSDPAGAAERVYNALSPGGVFALSLPSVFGPQYIFHRKEWVAAHPVDHQVDFSPFTVKKFLRKIGFRDIIIEAGAIHAERVLHADSFLFRPFRAIYANLSGRLVFSDTMRVYAIK